MHSFTLGFGVQNNSQAKVSVVEILVRDSFAALLKDTIIS